MTDSHYHYFIGRNWTVARCECGLSYREYRDVLDYKYPGWR